MHCNSTHLLGVVASLLVANAAPLLAQESGTTVDLALVLAVDVSLSMDNREQRLQRDGYAAAFRDPLLIDAITGRGQGRIAVAYLEWGGSDLARLAVPWTLIDGRNAGRQFAAAVENAPRLRANRTSISNALYAAAALLEESGYVAERRVIDISGDGPNNQGDPILVARRRIIERDITINGLPILVNSFHEFGFLEFRNLEAYYSDCVIGGRGSFLVPVRHEGEFGDAIRRKLLLEVSGEFIAPQLIPVQAKAPSDCLIGEKLWGQ